MVVSGGWLVAFETVVNLHVQTFVIRSFTWFSSATYLVLLDLGIPSLQLRLLVVQCLGSSFSIRENPATHDVITTIMVKWGQLFGQRRERDSPHFRDEMRRRTFV